MDALWVNERLHDYSNTLNEISDSINTLNISEPEIILSEEEGEPSKSTSVSGLCFNRKHYTDTTLRRSFFEICYSQN